MSKLKKIDVRPMKGMDTMELRVSSKKAWDLTGVAPADLNKVLEEAFKLVSKTEGAFALTKIGEESFVNNTIKTSAIKKKNFFFPEPNPVCIYYKSANEHLEQSLILKKQFLEIEAIHHPEYKFEVVVDYFQQTSEGIMLLCSTIEGFINQLIPDDFETEINGKMMNKGALEWLDVSTKIKELLPQLKKVNFAKTNHGDYSNITDMVDLRNDLIHLKTNTKPNRTAYQDLLKRLLDFRQVENSNSVFDFVNTVEPDYFVEKADPKKAVENGD